MKKVGKRMQKGSYDFNDFLVQAQTVRKMGGMNMIKLMPGRCVTMEFIRLLSHLLSYIFSLTFYLSVGGRLTLI